MTANFEPTRCGEPYPGVTNTVRMDGAMPHEEEGATVDQEAGDSADVVDPLDFGLRQPYFVPLHVTLHVTGNVSLPLM